MLENNLVFGSVNANRGHWEAAAEALADADRAWLTRLLTRTAPLDDYQQAFRHDDTDVKVVLEINAL